MVINFNQEVKSDNYVNIFNLKLSESTVYNSPITMESINRSIQPDFIYVYNATTQNDTYAETLMDTNPSDWLRATNFNFSFVSYIGTEITGIRMEIDDYGSAWMAHYDDIRLVFNNTIVSDIGEHWIPPGGVQIIGIGRSDRDYYHNFGNITDTWNSNLTVDQIKNETFGVQVCYKSIFLWPAFANVDHIRMKIYYTHESNVPTWNNLLEIEEPLEFGDNETISLNVYDQNNFTVYIELDGVNYTMVNVEGNNYVYNWCPLTSGIKNYKIWMVDVIGNTNCIIRFIRVYNTPDLVLSISILFLLMVLMLIFYLKVRIFLIIGTIFLFSLIIGMVSISKFMLPFSPYIQLLFLTFQSVFFIITTLELKEKLRG